MIVYSKTESLLVGVLLHQLHTTLIIHNAKASARKRGFWVNSYSTGVDFDFRVLVGLFCV